MLFNMLYHIMYWYFFYHYFMVVIVAWNVRGIISSTLCLSALLDREHCDIAIISEHKLKHESRMYLDSIHRDFYSIVRIDDNQLHNDGSFSGKGGVAIMYRKSLSFSVKEISCFDFNCVVGIQLTDSSGNSWYIFGVQ